MLLRIWATILILVSSAQAAEPRPSPEEYNALIQCLREQIAAAPTQEAKREPWHKLTQVVRANANFARYINAANPGSVDLTEPFAVHMEHVDAGSNKRDPFGMDINLLVFRGDPESLKLNEIPMQRQDGFYVTQDVRQGVSLSRADIADTGRLSLKSLYDEFEDQPGRAENIGKYSAQDLKPIATHFVLLVKGKPVARIQVQVSADHSVELNYEENFPELPKLAPPGERRAEVGRNGVVRASKRASEAQQIIENSGGDEHLRDLLFQKSFSWINSDVQLERVRFHVNGAVRRAWKQAFKPLQFDEEIKARENSSPAKTEWILAFSRANLLRAEEGMLARLMLDHVAKIRQDTVSYPATRKGTNNVTFYFRANEIAVVQRMGLLQFARVSGGSIHDRADTKILQFDVPQSRMAELQEYLKTKLLQPSK